MVQPVFSRNLLALVAVLALICGPQPASARRSGGSKGAAAPITEARTEGAPSMVAGTLVLKEPASKAADILTAAIEARVTFHPHAYKMETGTTNG